MINQNDASQTTILIDTYKTISIKLFVFSFVKEKMAGIGLEIDVTVCGLEILKAA